MSTVLVPEIDQYWREEESPHPDDWLDLVDPDGWWEARLKRDGCVDLRRFHNDPRDVQRARQNEHDLEDYLHICDLEDFLKRMITAMALAEHRFGVWPD